MDIKTLNMAHSSMRLLLDIEEALASLPDKSEMEASLADDEHALGISVWTPLGQIFAPISMDDAGPALERAREYLSAKKLDVISGLASMGVDASPDHVAELLDERRGVFASPSSAQAKGLN